MKQMKWADILKEGDRVIIAGDHPWATHAGTVIAWEHDDIFGGIELPKIRLDIGHEIFVTNRSQVRKTK